MREKEWEAPWGVSDMMIYDPQNKETQSNIKRKALLNFINQNKDLINDSEISKKNKDHQEKDIPLDEEDLSKDPDISEDAQTKVNFRY